VRVAIDTRKLHDFGIGTYVRNLVRGLARLPRDHEYSLICQPEDAEFVRALGPNFTAVPDSSGNYSIREQLSIPYDLWRMKADVFHAPHYVLPPLAPGKSVVTIHDCIHLRFPQYLPNRIAHEYAKVFLTNAARKAVKVLTVSDASKRDIIHFLGTPAEKIEVVYNGFDERLTTPSTEDVARVRERFQLHSPFILYAGNIKPHKNVDRLIDAFAALKARGAANSSPEIFDVKLLIIGDDVSKYSNLRRLVHRHQLHQYVRFLGFVPDDTLAVLYRLACVFVFPSLYEGFGLPPLEAMASGTPVITSNVSSLPEVVGDAALMIDPQDADGLAMAMERVLTTPTLRDDLIRRGHERVKAFSWERSVARIHDIYNEVARA
jgi:glycosyltransferase involved in cell wall biosynthesis